jgi:hypothetical protein
MEKYIVKVIIENVSGKVVGTASFDTATIAEIKAFGDTSIVDNFIKTTIENIADDRRQNPHHHQNRLD